MFDSCIVQANDETQMRKTGISLAKTLYRRPCTIVLLGELGAGKTTFVQGFAEGLDVRERVTSPTYALEQRYGEALSHIDLYRLEPAEAHDFMRTLDPFRGVRMIEWGNRMSAMESDIEISITEEATHRNIQASFHDIAVPPDEQICEWMEEAMLPQHIQAHVRKVAEISDHIAEALVQQGRLVRGSTLHAAALVHDLLRFVDFASLAGDATYSPTPQITAVWTALKSTYGTPHESAVQKFVAERGYADIGAIVRTHRGHGQGCVPETIEQQALAYADKRALMDRAVTLDERFNDFLIRYGKGVESAEAREWRTEMKRIERVLFPDGVPF